MEHGTWRKMKFEKMGTGPPGEQGRRETWGAGAKFIAAARAFETSIFIFVNGTR